MSNVFWENGLRSNINQAFDPIVFPERIEIAQRNAEAALRRRDYSIHLLDKMLPLDSENPRYPCYRQDNFCRISYSRRRRCRCDCRRKSCSHQRDYYC